MSSQRNRELAEEGIAACNATYSSNDLAPWRDQVERNCDPEMELRAGTGTSAAFTEGEWRGLEGAVGFVANQMEVLREMWIRIDEFIDVDEDRFIIGVSFGGNARHTGIPVELHPFHLFTLRGGKILRWQIFQERDAAIEAAGRPRSTP